MSTPRVVLNALVPDERKLPGGLILSPLSIAHVLLMEKIDSPFLKVGERPAKPSRNHRAKSAMVPMSELDGLAVVFVLTRSETEIDQLFYGFDRASFDRSVWSFAKSQSPALLVGLQPKLEALFAHATSTLIGGGADAPADQKKMT